MSPAVQPSSADASNKNAADPSPNTNRDDFSKWVADAQKQIETDKRAQPWKGTFGESVDRGFSGKDDIMVRGEDDVQHNSVAA